MITTTMCYNERYSLSGERYVQAIVTFSIILKRSRDIP